MDLGRKITSPEGMTAPISGKEAPKITYPGFSLSDKVAEQFHKDYKPKLGDYFTGTVRLCVTSLSADKYGSRVEFDVEKLDDITAETGEDEGADAKKSDEAETKAFGYKRKASKKEAPELSAGDLED